MELKVITLTYIGLFMDIQNQKCNTTLMDSWLRWVVVLIQVTHEMAKLHYLLISKLSKHIINLIKTVLNMFHVFY